MSAFLKIDHVGITFPTDKGPREVLREVTLDIAEGEFISLIGHSGCGKSTVLNIVAGLLNASEGGVLLSDRIVMMTNGPSAAIGEVLNVDPLRPRGRLALAEDPTFNHYRAEVVKFLHDRHAQPDVPGAAKPPKREPPRLKLAANG